MPIRVHLRNGLFLILFALMIGPGMVFPQEIEEKARRFAREVEFNYLDWTLDTLWLKASSGQSNQTEQYGQQSLVYSYLNLVEEVQGLDNQITIIYADPEISDPAMNSKELAIELKEKQDQLQELTPVLETTLQELVRTVLLEEDLDTLSVLFPPVLFHTSDMPLSLFISPRDQIKLEANISLNPTLSEAEIVNLEKELETEMDVSALIEEIGGLGTYPTMIMLTTDLNWLVETIAHEWVHNYLALHPLGINYETTPELRTMNETTATLAGKEIGKRVIERYFPDRIPMTAVITSPEPTPQATPPAFDFREEMRITRVQVDRFLSDGKIEEAEAYMEMRRRIFWNNGYLIRRINQAYFAFHGAYNDTPGGGASGSDPVGPAVVTLREKTGSLGIFLKTIAGMSSYNQLEEAVGHINN
jgi:hypothetical protein